MIAFKRSQKLGTCLGVSLVIGKKLRDGQLKIVRKSHVAIPFFWGIFVLFISSFLVLSLEGHSVFLTSVVAFSCAMVFGCWQMDLCLIVDILFTLQ